MDVVEDGFHTHESKLPRTAKTMPPDHDAKACIIFCEWYRLDCRYCTLVPSHRL